MKLTLKRLLRGNCIWANFSSYRNQGNDSSDIVYNQGGQCWEAWQDEQDVREWNFLDEHMDQEQKRLVGEGTMGKRNLRIGLPVEKRSSTHHVSMHVISGPAVRKIIGIRVDGRSRARWWGWRTTWRVRRRYSILGGYSPRHGGIGILKPVTSVTFKSGPGANDPRSGNESGIDNKMS